MVPKTLASNFWGTMREKLTSIKPMTPMIEPHQTGDETPTEPKQKPRKQGGVLYFNISFRAF